MKKKICCYVLFIVLVILLSLSFGCSTSYDLTNNQWYLRNDGQTIEDVEGVRGEDIGFVETLFIEEANSVIGIMDEGVNFDNQSIKTSQYVNEAEIPNNGIDDDLNGYIDDVNGWDFYNNDNTQFDYFFSKDHGTVITNILVGSNSNGYEPLVLGAKVLSLKVFESEMYNIDALIAAINYAESMETSVMIISFELLSYNEELYQVMKKSDILFVCSSGNNNSAEVSYPARFKLENLIVVGGIANTGYPYSKTNYGDFVDVYAPAKDIYSMKANGEYDYFSGTSFAVPQVAALAYYFIELYNLDCIEAKRKVLSTSRTSEKIIYTNQYVIILDYGKKE
ncbi:MAG: S8 family serine peptidase [Tenericutes bacterium]|nr:S8 family serine peptidase [Mycoplasmatota bacterium]